MNKDIKDYEKADFLSQLRDNVVHLDSARKGSTNKLPVDLSFEDLLKGKYNLSKEDYLDKLGINTRVETMANIYNMPDQSIRWVVPEIIRDAVTLGLNQAPIYPTLITSDQPINGLQAVLPYINQSDAVTSRLNEAETIPLGTISFGSKKVNLFKVGKGIKITDEVKNYVSLDVMGIYFRDFGIQLGYSLDNLAIDTLTNGDKIDGSESAPVMGVTTSGTLVYKDLLRIWVRAARMGRNFSTLVGEENLSLDLLDLPEFKQRSQGTTQATLNVKSPVPNSADYYIHGAVPTSSLILVDKSAAMIKLTAQPLMMESERIVSNQTEAVYASLTTGFSKMYRDASVVIDKTKAFSSNGFPSYMDVDAQLKTVLD